MINSKMVGEFLETVIEHFVDHLEFKYGFEAGGDDEDGDYVEYHESEAYNEALDIVGILGNTSLGYAHLSVDRKSFLLSGLIHLQVYLEEYLTEIVNIQDPEAEAEAIINFIKEDVK